jgi:drug/metabolite transporter (DMT)-like permease
VLIVGPGTAPDCCIVMPASSAYKDKPRPCRGGNALAKRPAVGRVAAHALFSQGTCLRTELICIAIVALMWGGYPLIVRSSGIGTPIGGLILTLSALIPVSIATLWHGVPNKPANIALLKLTIAGVLMGIGMTAFNYVANSRRIDASISIPIIDVAMLIVSVVAAVAFFSEPVTLKKGIGLALLVAGMIVLRPE